MSSTCPPSQPCSAQLQTKYTLLSNSRTSNTSPVLISDESVGPKRTRTTSTSSVDTIRISPGKKKSSSSKKRARASEPSSNGECDQTFLQDIRRTRQRKLSTDTVRATVPSAVAFPALSDSHERASSPGSPRNETGGVRAKKKDAERKVTPPKLNPGHAAPSVAITPVSRADDSVLEVSSPTSNRHAPPPPIANAIRTRVLSMKNPPSPSLPTSPAHRTIMHSAYRTYGFDPLPAYLQDWQPPCTPYVLSDDEDSYDGAAPSSDSSWKDEWDNTHPGMSDLDLSISFHKKQPFFDVWDLPDDIYIAVPARLHLTLKKPQQWKELSEPDLRYIDIRCNTFEYRSPLDYYPPEYSVSYNGASSTEYADPTIVPADLSRGVIVNRKWNKSFPGNKIRFKESLITNYGRLPDDSIGEVQGEDDDDSISKRGWFFKFMIPIPSWVLRQGNTRAFTVEAAAWVGGLDEGGLLRGDTELVISHLRSEREMIKSSTQCL